MKLAWVVTMFKYRPFEGYFGEDVIKVRHILRCSMNSSKLYKLCQKVSLLAFM